jgi:uroporphyrinogen decarboxylase
MMTPRERWLAVFAGRTTDRLPTDYWATAEFHAKLKQSLGIADDEQVLRKLGIDQPCGVGATWKLKHHPNDPLADAWGIRRETIQYGTGSYAETAHHPLAAATTVADVNAFRWPEPDDFDVTGIPAAIARNAGYRFVRGGHYEPFLLYCDLRGMEQAYEDLLLEPAIAEAALAHIFEFFYEHNRRIWEAGAGQIDVMYLAEDLGGQSGPLFSLDLYRRFLRPNQIKMAELAHSFGLKVFYHTDGAARCFLPDLVNVVGIDLLNPLQWRCPGMELAGLVRDYSEKLVFHGGIDNQQTLPFGTVADVRREVRECAAIMRDSRWICAPCHNIQNVTPVANMLALYEEVDALGSKS